MQISFSNNICTVLKLFQFAKIDTCENWFGLPKSCVYYVHQTCEIYQVLPYSVDFQAPGFEIHWVGEYSIYIISFDL